MSKEIMRVLETSQDPIIQVVRKIEEHGFSYEQKRAMATLSGEITKGVMTFEQAVRLTESPIQFRKTLTDLIVDREGQAHVSVEYALVDEFEKSIVKMNELHDEPNRVRFQELVSFSPKEMYLLLATDGFSQASEFDQIAYPSTYQGIFTNMLDKLASERGDGFDLIEQTKNFNLRFFLNMAAQRGRVGDFLNTMPKEKQKQVLTTFFSNLGQESDVAVAAGVAADVARNLTDPEQQTFITSLIRNEFEKARANSDVQSEAVYGLLSVLQDASAEWVPVDERERFKLPDQSKLEIKDLEKDGIVVERYYFYNDQDGRGSFQNFLNGFEGKQGWKVEKKKGYVIVHSTRGHHNVRIFANDPRVMSETGTAIQDKTDLEKDPLDAVMQEQGLTPTVVVHRGHIYHQQHTIDRAPDSVKLFILGSCGGYATIGDVVSKHQNAQVLSTKGTGTKMINDTLLRILETQLTSMDMIDWSDFWQTAENRLRTNQDFKDYVPPNENFYGIVSARVQAFVEHSDTTM